MKPNLAAERRIARLTGHFCKLDDTTQVHRQDCAASHAIRYAKPARHEDLKFAQVGAQDPYELGRDAAALQFADHTLNVLSKGQDRFTSIPDPAAFARPALKEQMPQEHASPMKPAPVVAPTRIPRLTDSRFFTPRLTAGWVPKVDAVQMPSHYKLEVAIPGIRKDDLRVELWGPYLTISGARNGAAMGMRRPRAAGAAAGGKGIVLRRELDHGFFSSTWKLPANGVLDSLYAEYVDGILRISMRKQK